MILRLRRRHLAVFSLLAVVLPAGIVASVVSRDPLPVAPDIPAALGGGIPAEYLGQLKWSRGGPLWDEFGIEVARAPNPDGPPFVIFRPTRDLKAPKVLVYWAPGLQKVTALPKQAVLLGSLAGTQPVQFALPPAMRNRAGRFILYSLGHQAVLGEAPTTPPDKS